MEAVRSVFPKGYDKACLEIKKINIRNSCSATGRSQKLSVDPPAGDISTFGKLFILLVIGYKVC